MPITLGTTIGTLKAQRFANQHAEAKSRVFERLATGQRINRASDDPAGLAVAAALKSQERSYAKAIQNVNEGISALSMADQALEIMGSLVTRLQELAEQSANSTFTLAQRRATQKESDQLVDEYNRIISTTALNGVSLFTLNGDAPSFTVQDDILATTQTTFSLGNSIDKTVSTATMTYSQSIAAAGSVYTTQLVDMNNDGKLDLVDAENFTLNVRLGNGDGSFAAASTYGAAGSTFVGDFNGDGYADVASGAASTSIYIRLNNGSGGLGAATAYAVGVNVASDMSIADFNNDGALDIVVGGYDANAGVAVLLGNGNGTFKTATNYFPGTWSWGVSTGDFNGDGKIDFAMGNFTGGKLNVAFGDGTGGFTTMSNVATNFYGRHMMTGDVNFDGYDDIAGTSGQILLSNGDGTFSSVTVSGMANGADNGLYDINDDGKLDVIGNDLARHVLISLGNGDGTFQTPTSVTAGTGSGAGWYWAFGDLNRDGSTDIAAGVYADNNTAIVFSNNINTTSLKRISLLSVTNARNAIAHLNSLVGMISQERGNVGAYMSRMSANLSYLSSMKENSKVSRSRIQDSDVAGDTVDFIRQKILQRTSSTLLAQTKSSSAIALKLLS